MALFGSALAHAAEPPWETAFLTAPPGEVLAAARAVTAPPEAEVIVLHEEVVRTFDADGKSRSRYRQVYLVIKDHAVESWSRAGATWDRWHEDAPQLRARVTGRDGTATALDPKTIEINTDRPGDPNLYTDRQVMRAPLPAVSAGSVVELEIMSTERAPFFDAGVTGRFYFSGIVPVQRARLVIDAPAALAIKAVPRQLPGMVGKTSTRDGRRVTVFEGGPYPAGTLPPPGTPPEQRVFPHVAFGTGSTWNRIATRYRDLVETQLQGADVRALAAEVTAGARGRAAISRLLERLSRDVRYTGIEFGVSSIIPTPPAQVLSRRYGDCKDKALLLVALLRAVGQEAHLALLNAGSGADTDEELPGLEPFNHAIVFVPGTPPLWIDPTDRFTPVGELPLADQGRLALVARRETKSLVRTPRAASTVNRIQETREVTVTEEGISRVVERSLSHGAAGSSMRDYHAGTSRKDVEEQLASYVSQTYGARRPSKIDHSDPFAVGAPFSLELVVDKPEIGEVWDGGAQVFLGWQGLFEQLPPSLRPSTGGKATPEKDEPRTQDYLLPRPFVHEIHYRIVPPHGFAPDELPAAETLPIGPGQLRLSYEKGADGTVGAHLTFDTGPGRMSPAALKAFQEALHQLNQRDQPVIKFSLVGQTLLSAGRLRDALAEFRKLEAAHPGTVLHATQLATAYLAAGLGDAARRQAAAALKLDPRSARAHRTLGWVLQHDRFGRYMHRGHDAAGAEKAYRKALELDPSELVARTNLAVQLEHDEHGNRSWPRRHLTELLVHYDRLREAGQTEYEVNRLIALVRGERYKEAIERARPMASSSNETAAMLVAAVALSQGVPAALKEAATLVGDDSKRPEVIRLAAVEATIARRYPEAATLFTEAARGHAMATNLRQFADRLRQTRRLDKLEGDPRDPVAVVRRFWWMAIRGAFRPDGPEARGLKALLLPELAAGWSLDELRHGIDIGQKRAQSEDLTPQVIADMTAAAEFSWEGDVRWLVRVRRVGQGDASTKQDVFLVPRPGGLRLAAAPGHQGPVFGREVIRLIDAGDLAGARYVAAWLWGRADSKAPGDDAAMDAAKVPRDAHELRIAAVLALALTRQIDAAAIATLESCKSKPLAAGMGKACEAALIDALVAAGRTAEALAMAAAFHARYPQEGRALDAHVRTAMAAGQHDQARSLLREWTRTHPDDVFRLRWLAAVEQDPDTAEPVLRSLATGPRAEARDLNDLAWNSLVRGKSGAAVTEMARRAVQLSGRSSAAQLHTLASALAEANEPEEAQQLLIELLDLRSGPLDLAHYYLIGRIAEGYGATEAARDAYRAVPRPAKTAPGSVWTMIDRRLRALEGTTAPRTPEP